MSTGSALVPINGRPLFVEITPSSPAGLAPFVSLHGLGGATNLFPIGPALVGSYTVIKFDFEGAGRSPLSGKLSIESFVADVKAVLEFAGFEGQKAVIYGHSLGAAVAQHFAATHPYLTARVILSCPGLPRSGSAEGLAASNFLANLARTVGPFNMADNTAAKNCSPTSSYTARALVRAAMQLSTPEGYAQTSEMIALTPAPEYDNIVADVMIIAGLDDQIASVAAAEAIKALLVNANSAEVKPVQAGHQPAAECPETVIELLKAFLGF